MRFVYDDSDNSHYRRTNSTTIRPIIMTSYDSRGDSWCNIKYQTINPVIYQGRFLPDLLHDCRKILARLSHDASTIIHNYLWSYTKIIEKILVISKNHIATPLSLRSAPQALSFNLWRFLVIGSDLFCKHVVLHVHNVGLNLGLSCGGFGLAITWGRKNSFNRYFTKRCAQLLVLLLSYQQN